MSSANGEVDKREDAEWQEGVAKKFYWAGWALLPFLWLLNWGYFRTLPAERKTEATRWYLRYGLAQMAVVLVLMTAWGLTFVFARSSMGSAGETLAVVTPKGHL